MMELPVNTILQGDSLAVLKTLPDESVDCCITSPPYWAMRNYLHDDDPQKKMELGLETTFEEYLVRLVAFFDEVHRVLKKTGTLFVNLGDTYAGTMPKTEDDVGDNRKIAKKIRGGIKSKGSKNQSVSDKSLCMIPERFAIAMIEKGWIVRNKIIWHKKNGMPSSVTDRLSNKYEVVYFFSKSGRYFFDLDSIRAPYETEEQRPDGIVRAREFGYNTKQGTKRHEMETQGRRFGKRRPPQSGEEYVRNPKGKNPGDVWTLTLQPHPEQHVAMFPEKLITKMVMAGCPEGGIILDPFLGSGTVGVVAKRLKRQWLGIELNPAYIEMAERRIKAQQEPML